MGKQTIGSLIFVSASNQRRIVGTADAGLMRYAWRMMRALIILSFLHFLTGPICAESRLFPSAPPGIVESGVPLFVVLGPEALGLSAPPTDLKLLPDGRIVAIGQSEIAFSDGVRWEVFRQANDQAALKAQVAVDQSGQIYAGIEGHIARIEFGADARWRCIPVAALPVLAASIAKSTMNWVEMVPGHWFWNADSGAIIEWQPGEQARAVGQVSSIQRIFSLDEAVFFSEQASGELFRLSLADGTSHRVESNAPLASEAITSAIPVSPGKLLLGTAGAGLRLFNGASFEPFHSRGVLGRNSRINDLCVVGDGLFAAAVDTVGIVIFDREGNVLQVLDHALDHRLGRAHRLQFAKNGVLWALLSEGVLRVDLPSPLSHFSPLIASGLTYARPFRHEGQLWIIADGRLLHGQYDDAGRLEKFDDDSPPGRFVHSIDHIGGDLFAANDVGLFVFDEFGWKPLAKGIVNARVNAARGTAAGSLYVARGEVGFIRRTAEGFAIQRIPVPELGEAYGSVQDDAGIVWLELGNSRVGRVDLSGDTPSVKILSAKEGLSDGWVEIYLFEGVARFHLPNHLFRFDSVSQRFVEDRELLTRYPQFYAAAGRPVVDRLGRIWYAITNMAYLIDASASSKDQTPQKVPVGFGPEGFYVEDNGVVWMTEKGRMVRVDSRIPSPPSVPLRVLITAVQFPFGNRHLFSPGSQLPSVDFSDNSLIIHFACPANPFTTPVTFEVMLEGAGSQWTSTGTVASAAFNHLKEGRYTFRVRPVTDGTSVTGAEARLEFTVLPPWYRTKLAWFGYVLTAVGLIAFAAWFSSFLQRRENVRLERLVTERTEELTARTDALSVSEERFRALNIQLESRVQERTAQLSLSKDELQQRELLFRLIFEHAPVGISWKRADLGTQHHFNPTFCRILELPAPMLPDFSLLTAMLHPDDAAKQAELSRLIESGRGNNYSVEQRYVRPDGQTVWGRLSVAVVRDQQGAIIQDIGILEDITSRKKAEGELADTYKNLVDVSRTAGMAEVATGVLHNVGNVLNSLNVSATIVATGLRQSKAEAFAKVAALLREHSADLGAFLTGDPKGKRVPEYIDSLAKHFVEERARLLGETESLQHDVEHIKEIVSMQQSYATMVSTAEPLDPVALIEDSLRMNTTALNRHHVKVVREFQPVPPVLAEKGKAIQILVNLIGNAKYACTEGGATDRVMTLAIEPGGLGRVRLIVRDNGIGIAPENITRIFGHGFTTKATGHGFGLHSSANAAKEMKGSLSAQSDGPGRGATFILELPIAPATPAPADKVAALEGVGTA